MSDNKKLTETLIPKDNKKAKMSATFYSDKSIGGGDSEIFDEYVDVTDQQRNTALANVSNQTANSTTGKMGYKVLDPTKTFAEQVTDENTIYEIRDVFSNIGTVSSPYTIPQNCTIKINGGKITNSYIEGNVDVIAEDYDTVKGVFLDGYNIAGKDSVQSNKIGLVENDANFAQYNHDIIQKVINSCKELVLTDKYYITSKFNVSSSICFEGGQLIFNSDGYSDEGFVPLQNAELIFRNVTFNDVGLDKKTFIITKDNIDYKFKGIEFTNCVFYGARPVYIIYSDISYETTPFGINYFLVQNCRFLEGNLSLFILSNCIVSEQFLFKSNYIENAQGTAISCGITNEYTYGQNNRKYQCDFIVEDNIFLGACRNTTSYYCPCLFEVKNVFFKRNIVKNYIMYGTGVAYDSYCNSTAYYFENNYIENVVSLPSTGTPNETSSEILKSKGCKYIYAFNNVWNIDFNKCRQILSDNSTTFTDEQFEAINFVAIFGIVVNCDLLKFENNEINIVGGKLKMRSSSLSVKEVCIKNNKFNIEKIINGETLAPIGNAYNEKNYFENNIVNITNADTRNVINIFSSYSDFGTERDCTVIIKNNISNKQLSVPVRAKYCIFENNAVISEAPVNTVLYITKSTGYRNIKISNFIFPQGIYPYVSDVSGVTVHVPKTNSNTGRSIAWKTSFGIKVNLIGYNILKYFYFDNNGKVYDEYGIELYDSEGMSSYTNVFTISGVFTISIQNNNNNKGILINNKNCDIEMSFIDIPHSVSTYDAGKTRYNPTAGRMELWNGTAWVNLDGTALG